VERLRRMTRKGQIESSKGPLPSQEKNHGSKRELRLFKTMYAKQAFDRQRIARLESGSTASPEGSRGRFLKL
jgi:hypothetical protein